MHQIHAVVQFWRASLTTERERAQFEEELAASLDSDLKLYRSRMGVVEE